MENSHQQGMDETPDSPLSFSVPTSLQDYIRRYVDRTENPTEAGAAVVTTAAAAAAPRPPPNAEHVFPSPAVLSAEPFPVRHWFDESSSDTNIAHNADARPAPATHRRPASSSRNPGGGDALLRPAPASAPVTTATATTTAAARTTGPAAAQALAASATVAHQPAAAAAAGEGGAASAPAGATTTSPHSPGPTSTSPQHNYLSTWRITPTPPLLGPSDSGCEEDEEPASGRFSRSDGGGGNGGNGGNGVRPHTRSASRRGGRPRGWSEARTVGGGSEGRTRSIGSSGGTTTTSTTTGSSAGSNSHTQLLAMIAAAGGGDSSSSGGGGGGGSDGGGGGSRWHEERRTSAINFQGAGADARNVYERRWPAGLPLESSEAGAGAGVGEERPPVVSSGSRLVAGQQGRSLSDLLREIEETMRAQRAEREEQARPLTGRTQSEPPVHSAPALLPAPASPWPAADYPRADNPPRGNNTRYLNPGGSRRPSRRGAHHAGDANAPRSQRTATNRSAHVTPPPPVQPPSVTRGDNDDDDNNASDPSRRSSNRGLPDTFTVSAHSRTGTRTLATVAAAAAGARGAVLAATDAPVTAAARTSVSAQTPINPPMRLSATATAFSLGGVGGSISPGRSGGGEGTSIEDRARARAWLHRQYATSLDQQQQQQQQQQTGQAIGTHARGEFLAAMAAMRTAAAAGRQPGGDGPHARGGNGGVLGNDGGGVAGGGTGAGSTLAHGGAVTGLHRTPGAYTQALTRSSYMTALAPEAPASATGGVGAAGGVVAGPAIPSELSSGSSGNGGGGGGSRTVGNQSSLAALPAFRHWESQRARLRIQWHDSDAQSVAIRTESLPSDGTLVLTEHLSAGPSPRGFSRSVPDGGNWDASEVEEALFSCLTSLNLRRLLLERGRGTVASGGYHRHPAWLDEWLDSGAPLSRTDGGGLSGHEGRCPRVGDVWELLELLLAWWAERVCAVAAGFPVYREAVVGNGVERRGGGIGSLAGDVVAAAQAVESIQGLRKLGECLLPLSQVRSFIGVDEGPTPRDAVLLKSLLIVHEGIAWVTDRPSYRYYREEIIPTALALYNSLPQDALEGVDLEVGHTLPESMFAMTGTVRPSWPRWGGNPSSPPPPLGQPSIASGSGGGGDSNRSSSSSSSSSSSGGGSGWFGASFVGENPMRGGSGGGSGGTGSVGGWGGGGARFMPGPWMVFRVARQDYLDFYAGQASALEQMVGGSSAELEDMLC